MEKIKLSQRAIRQLRSIKTQQANKTFSDSNKVKVGGYRAPKVTLRRAEYEKNKT